MQIVVSRLSFRAEASAKVDVDLIDTRILAVVRMKQSENLCHRKGKGSLTMQFSQGLVDPNFTRNST